MRTTREPAEPRLLAFERRYRDRGFRWIAGVDEAGRGPLAGPVVAAAAVFASGASIPGIDDSKNVPERRREILFRRIMTEALDVGIGIAGPGEIDQINILRATERAMRRALRGLRTCPDCVLVDGMRIPEVGIHQEAIVRGDARCRCIAGASIVAKVTRDRIMRVFDRRYPGYGFSRHKGYPTPEHLAAIERLGILPIHRMSYGPVRRVIEERSDPGRV